VPGVRSGRAAAWGLCALVRGRSRDLGKTPELAVSQREAPPRPTGSPDSRPRPRRGRATAASAAPRERARRVTPANESQVCTPKGRPSYTTSTPKIPAGATAIKGKTSTTQTSRAGAHGMRFAPEHWEGSPRRSRGVQTPPASRQQQRHAVERTASVAWLTGWTTIWAPNGTPRDRYAPSALQECLRLFQPPRPS